MNGRGLRFECERMLQEDLLVLVIKRESETVVWGEKERFRIRGVQMDNLRGWLGIRIVDGMPYIWLTELCGRKKEAGERIENSVFPLFEHIEE